MLEARESFGGVTSGVRISAKGVRVLEKIGIHNIGENTEKLVMYFGTKHIKFDVKNEKDASPAILVTRLAVFEKLRERINELGINIIYKYKLDNVIENADNVVAVSSDGKKIQGKYLVGADGVGSKVRSLLNAGGTSEKRYAGYLGLGFIYPSDEKIEMSLFNILNGNIGLGSIGKISPDDTCNNNFLWAHIHMSEAEAKAISDKEVFERIAERAKGWTPHLRQVFQEIKANPKTILYHQPVYNGNLPSKWFNDRLFLIGDAAHPYGPGGQGISLAMLDAEALCSLFTNELTEEKKINFQITRAAIAKEKGESSEERNKPENQITSNFGLWWKGVFMKGFHLFSGGKIEL
ncbi:NAD(P)/FAD-dependent oxidoreductase [Pseudanabaena sp. 'Roaring Creek']|uniref:FAD-dependent oxidoreductase n=1 Tax=Pseudanabaena sp. 'Roaring Creek' TaxID=1681830 RepID=UPI0006D846C8|nr:NAD(P)/FAD-dependent oxidoreductase [Pseudanabaena sp. 'Roaring Creek']